MGKTCSTNFCQTGEEKEKDLSAYYIVKKPVRDYDPKNSPYYTKTELYEKEVKDKVEGKGYSDNLGHLKEYTNGNANIINM